MVVGVVLQLEAYPFKSTKRRARYKNYNVARVDKYTAELKKNKTPSPVLVIYKGKRMHVKCRKKKTETKDRRQVLL